MIEKEVNDRPQWSAAFGVLPAMVLSIFAFIPTNLWARYHFGIPFPSPLPRPARGYPVEVATSYWVTWIVCLIVFLVPGVVLTLVRRTRKVGLGYLITVVVICGLSGGIFAILETGGTAPG